MRVWRWVWGVGGVCLWLEGDSGLRLGVVGLRRVEGMAVNRWTVVLLVLFL